MNRIAQNPMRFMRPPRPPARMESRNQRSKRRLISMLIESSKPLTVRLRSSEVHLTPGQPVEFSEEDGLKLLVKAKGKVRMIQHQPVDWLYEWRCLAALTSGMGADDPRLPVVFQALDQCDTAFLAGDYPAFMLAAAQVQEAMKPR